MSEVQAEAPALSQMQRLVNLFLAPSATFQDIRRSASWWLPYVLMALASLAVAYSIEHKVGFEQLFETQIHLNPTQQSQLNQLDPAARAMRLHAVAVGYRWTTYSYPILLLLTALFAALILWASFSFVLGAVVTYPQMLALWLYASLPRLLTAMVTLVTLWFGGSPENFNLQMPAGTNPGYYLSDAPNWERVLLSFFDIGGLWSLVLLILGAAIVCRVKTLYASVVVIGWWLLILVVSVGATAAFQ
jgi:hypothetical protein